MPIVAELLERDLHRRPRTDLHPDLAVAFGAGVMAARLMGSQRHRILVDVTPYTFGTSCVGKLDGDYVSHAFAPIIRAGTPVPARKGQVFYTMYPGQDAVDVRIFQGESRDARENLLIGNFRVEDLDEDTDGGSEILLNMALDLDGILHVTAVERHTGLSKSVSIEKATAMRDEAALEESRARIAEMFDAPDDAGVDDSQSADDDEAAEEESADEEAAEADGADREVLARVAAALPQLDEVDAADITRARVLYLAALEAGDEVAARRAHQEMDDILFYVESK
jgi:molecular chaperone DnaK (HSP70)